MSKNKFQTVLTSVNLPESVLNPYLHQLAREVDEARREYVYTLRNAGQRLVELSAAWEDGRCYGENPLSSSAIYELPVLMTRAREREEMFWNTLESVHEGYVVKVKQALRAAAREGEV